MEFEGILKNISPKLRAIANRLGRRFSFFDADDLYQEAVIYLLERHRGGALSDKTDSYILQGCYFFMKNYIRVAVKSVDARSLSIDPSLSENNADGAVRNNLSLVDESRRFGFIVVDIMVDDMLKELTAREREIFELSLDELTTREIGDRLGISHVMIVKIRKTIREKCRDFACEIALKKRLPG